MIEDLEKSCLGMMLAFSLMIMTGCVPLIIGAAAGAGGMVYVKGALVENVDESVEDIHQASLAALKDLGIFVKSDELNRHSAVIKAEYEGGEKVEIKADAITEFVSKISIRVGLIGDQEDSRLILNAIEKRLK
ncbi:MAG: DUF3568 family protein [Candidatus Omnitrophica bacterium]|nr:DUF3568 family protein [Candidatus Omnitrophota bacterium]